MPSIVRWILALPLARAVQHHLFVGTYGTPAIYGLTYDDVSNSLTFVKNNTTRTENEWLALSYDGKTLYSSGRSGWSSFPVTGPNKIGSESSTTPPIGTCTNYGGVFILASKRAPYTVYGSLSCANYISVGPDGNVGKATQVPYNDAVVIYGMAMDPSHQYLYSSDWKNGKIWTHKVNNDGSLTVVGSVDAPSAVSAPRTVIVHPGGNALYVVLEAWNALALYTINKNTHLPEYTKALYPLIPASADAGNFGAQSAVVSAKGTQLWATTRSRTAGQAGWMTGLGLSESGMVTGMLFQTQTPTSGGPSNTIVSCPFAENVMALMESEKGSVSIWRYLNGEAKSVASVGINDAPPGGRGCCSDAVWLD